MADTSKPTPMGTAIVVLAPSARVRVEKGANYVGRHGLIVYARVTHRCWPAGKQVYHHVEYDILLDDKEGVDAGVFISCEAGEITPLGPRDDPMGCRVQAMPPCCATCRWATWGENGIRCLNPFHLDIEDMPDGKPPALVLEDMYEMDGLIEWRDVCNRHVKGSPREDGQFSDEEFAAELKEARAVRRSKA